MPGHPVSLEELRRVTGRSRDDIEASLAELYRLFIIPKARLIDGAERVSVEANARSLVLDWAGTQLPMASQKLQAAWQTIAKSTKRTSGLSGETSSIVRRSEALMAEGDYLAAERGLGSGISQRENDGALHGQLGRVYARWTPPRYTDARHEFNRARDLGFSEPAMCRDWVTMEAKAGEFSLAVDAGRAGLGHHPFDFDLRIRVADALWRLARTKREVTAILADLGEVVETLRPLTDEHSDLSIDQPAHDRAFALTAYALADRITALDRIEMSRSAYGRDPAHVVSQREGGRVRSKSLELERVRLRQILNRWNRVSPGQQQRDIAARLRPQIHEPVAPDGRRRRPASAP
jgi:hypothetical protein